VGAVRSVAIILALIAWFGSLVTLVVQLVLLRRSLRADRRHEQPRGRPHMRPRVRTIDRFRAAERRLSWGPRTIDRLPGISRQETAYRPGSPYPMAQRGPRPPDNTPRRARRPEMSSPQRQPLWPPDPDPERKPHTLLSATAVRPRPDGRTPPARGGHDQPPPPRSRRVPFDR
jgi:hypothetical protein